MQLSNITSLAALVLFSAPSRTSMTMVNTTLVVLSEDGSKETAFGSVSTASCIVNSVVCATNSDVVEFAI